jgi:hypothetical protein
MKMPKLMRTTNIGDIATIKPVLGTVERGTIDTISTRGINIITPCGPKFVKWCNVIEIKKENTNE